MQHKMSNEWLKTSHVNGHRVRDCYPSIWEAITSDMYISINSVSFFIYDGRISYCLLIFVWTHHFNFYRLLVALIHMNKFCHIFLNTGVSFSYAKERAKGIQFLLEFPIYIHQWIGIHHYKHWSWNYKFIPNVIK